MANNKLATKSQFDLSQARNRIVGHVELLPSEILDHPGQAWDHPVAQAKALTGILNEVGIVDEPLVYKSERANGAWVTIDGHLRKSLDPNKAWPCTVLDVTDEEADYILATHDPVGQMKQTNAEMLDALLSTVTSANEAVQEMFTDIAQKAGLYLEHQTTAEEEAEKQQYSIKVEAPIYKPSDTRPAISELYDNSKTQRLQAEIAEAEFLTAEERAFLSCAAQRHTVFHYNKIADFYAHASAATQRLMENSALIIIDFDRAIELGYVKLWTAAAEQYERDYDDA